MSEIYLSNLRTLPHLQNFFLALETQLEKVKSSVRRQRALSSGTSPSRHDSNPELKGTPKLRSDSSLTTAEKRAKRKSDIPKQGSNSSVATENEDRRDKLHVGPSIRSSKSENSLSIEMEDSFEILSETEVASLRKEEQDRKLSYGSALRVANVLKDGHVWQKRLVFRGKLTMHTAYDRQDNKEPASITAISVSRYLLSYSGLKVKWIKPSCGYSGITGTFTLATPEGAFLHGLALTLSLDVLTTGFQIILPTAVEHVRLILAFSVGDITAVHVGMFSVRSKW